MVAAQRAQSAARSLLPLLDCPGPLRAVIVRNLEGRIIRANREAIALVGPLDYLARMQPWRLSRSQCYWDADGRRSPISGAQRALQTDSETSSMTRIVIRNGEVVWMRARAVPIPEVGVMGVFCRINPL